MSDRVHVPGSRRVVGSLETAGADDVVVACPPHPQHGGSRSDLRLQTVSEALAPDVACLRFGYGPWDGGVGERLDAGNALRWATAEFDAVGLFGYSFGAAVALRTAAQTEIPLQACSALAPPAGLTAQRDVAEALGSIGCPVQLVVGERDTTVDWRPVAEAAHERGIGVKSVPDGHQFTGQSEMVADSVDAFLREQL